MYCPKCGKELIDEEINFCPVCGENLSKFKPQEKSAEVSQPIKKEISVNQKKTIVKKSSFPDFINIMIAIGIGLMLFIMRYNAGDKINWDLFRYQVPIIACIYFGMKRHFNKKIDADSKYRITFINSFSVGLILLLIASIFAASFYIISPDPIEIIFNSSKFIRTLDVLISSLIIGIVVNFFMSLFFVYRQF